MSNQSNSTWEIEALEIAIATLDQAIETRPLEERDKLDMTAMTLRGFLAAYRSEPQSREPDQQEIQVTQIEAFGSLIADRRLAAGLTVERVAELAQLPTATIRSVEEGKTPPAQHVLLRLLDVVQLELEYADIPWKEADRDPHWDMNCRIEDADPTQAWIELDRLMASQTGKLPFRCLFTDEESAFLWVKLSETPELDDLHRGLLLDAVADAAFSADSRVGIDVIALGPGTGKTEIALTASIQTVVKRGDTRLFLVDESFPLLSVCHRRAREVLPDRGCSVYGFHGDFLRPGFIEDLVGSRHAHRRRLISLLGFTLGTFDNEMRFVRSNLAALSDGDLLLVDLRIGHPFGPGAEHDLLNVDHGFVYGRSESASLVRQQWETFLSKPILRFLPNSVEASIERRIDSQPNRLCSYSVDEHAILRLPSGEERQFSVYRGGRYDPSEVSDAFRREGWELVQEWTYGPQSASGFQPFAAMLFRKSEQILMNRGS